MVEKKEKTKIKEVLNIGISLKLLYIKITYQINHLILKTKHTPYKIQILGCSSVCKLASNTHPTPIAFLLAYVS